MMIVHNSNNNNDDKNNPRGTTMLDSNYEFMIQWMKERIHLCDFKKSLWKDDEHTATAVKFLASPSVKIMLAIVQWETGDGGCERRRKLLLKCSNLTRKEIHSTQEVAYFLRTTEEDHQVTSIINQRNIGRNILYGTVATIQTATSVKHAIENITAPIVFKSVDWPQSLKQELLGHYHRLIASLQERVSHEKRETILHVPPECDFHLDVKDKITIKDIESLVILWTRQVKDSLSVVVNMDSNDSFGPMQEIEYWNHRCEDLSRIVEQLKQQGMMTLVLDFLSEVKSAYLLPFQELSVHTQRSLNEAEDNAKFLQVLKEPSKTLTNSNIQGISDIIKPLLFSVRFIATNSRYYNSKDKISGLLRKISNEVVRCCQSKISVKGLWETDGADLVSKLKASIKSATEWKSNYNQVAILSEESNHDYIYGEENNINSLKWDFNESVIFARVDAFIQRCRDLLDMYESKLQFDICYTKKVGVFGGLDGCETLKALEEIGELFQQQLQSIAGLEYDILDIRALHWHEDYNNFKRNMKDLDAKLVTIFKNAFEPLQCLPAAVDLLELIASISRREFIRRYVESKGRDIIDLFISNCGTVQSEFEEQRKIPPLQFEEPRYAGAALWAKTLLNSVKESWLVIQSSSFPFAESNVEEANEVVNSFVSNILEYQTCTHHQWMESISTFGADEINSSLEQPILRKVNLSKYASLMSNHDGRILCLLAEISCFQKVFGDEFEIPSAAQEVIHKRVELTHVLDQVKHLVEKYTELMGLMETEERHLFSPQLKILDKYLRPGLTAKLNWKSRSTIVEKYVKSCITEMDAVMKQLREFSLQKSIIRVEGRLIASTPLVFFPTTTTTNTMIGVSSSFQQYQKSNLCASIEKINASREKIERATSACKFLLNTQTSDLVKKEWMSFVDAVDSSLFESLRKAILKSLIDLGREGTGKTSTDERKYIFETNFVIENGRIECKPSLIDLTHVLNMTIKEIIASSSAVSRISTSLFFETEEEDGNEAKTATVDCNSSSYYKKMSGDEEIVAVSSYLMQSMSEATSYIRSVVTLDWEKYENLWASDKDTFIRRYRKSRSPLDTYKTDLSKNDITQMEIEREPNYSILDFIKIGFGRIKKTLFSHCKEWREKLNGLLQEDSRRRLNALDIRRNEIEFHLNIVPHDLDTLSITVHFLETMMITANKKQDDETDNTNNGEADGNDASSSLLYLQTQIQHLRETYDFLIEQEEALLPKALSVGKINHSIITTKEQDLLVSLSEYYGGKHLFDRLQKKKSDLLSETKTNLRRTIAPTAENHSKYIKILY